MTKVSNMVEYFLGVSIDENINWKEHVKYYRIVKNVAIFVQSK